MPHDPNEQEEVPEEKKKPPYSYASLIRLAIINSETQKVKTKKEKKIRLPHKTCHNQLRNPKCINTILTNSKLDKAEVTF